MMKLLVLCSLIALCKAEAPFAGYQASGWKPEGAAFNLPNEYGAPPQQQQQENPQEVEVEITQENIQFVGQLSETTTGFPNNEYLPPTTTPKDVEADVLRVQALPKIDAPSDFNVSPQNTLNTGEVQRGSFRQAPRSNFRQQPQAVRPLQQLNSFVPNQRNGRIQVQFGRQEAAVQNTYNRAPQPQNAYGAPQQDEDKNDETEQTNGRLQAPRRPQFGRQEAEVQPHQAYGPPQQKEQDVTDVPDYSEEEEDHTETETDDGSEEDQGPVIAVANAATNGQYYVLGQNNLLQKVVFMTSQTEDDRRNNGYTAQLRYSPVEPIKDPVYGYNEQGQLVRIYKRK